MFNWRLPYMTTAIIIALSALMTGTIDHSLALELHYERWTSEPYRLLTSSFAHLDWAHMLSNCAALVVIVFVWRRIINSTELAVAFILLALLSNILLLSLPIDIRYGGLSGVLHGLVVLLLYRDYRSGRYPLFVLIASAALTVKIIAELSGYRAPHFQGPHVDYIHAAGYVSGILCCAADYFYQRQRYKEAA